MHSSTAGHDGSLFQVYVSTGLVLPDAATPVWGEDPALAVDIVSGGSVIYSRSSASPSSMVVPGAALAAWASCPAIVTLLTNATANEAGFCVVSTLGPAPCLRRLRLVCGVLIQLHLLPVLPYMLPTEYDGGILKARKEGCEGVGTCCPILAIR